MAKQEVVNRSVNVYIQSGQAQKVYDTLIAKEKQLNDQLKTTSDPKRIAALNNELSKLAEPISRAAKKLSGELAPSLRDSQALAKQLNNELSRQFDPKKALQLKEVNGLIRQQKAEINGLAGAQNNIGKENGFTRMLDTAKGFVVGNIITKATEVVHEFFSSAIDEAIEADEKSQKFKSTLENLGRSDAFERLMDAADKMQERFKFLDNDDIVAVFNKLIDYGKLTEGQIKQLTPVIVDFATKTGLSLDEASNQIIQAIGGGKIGGELRRFGINLKDAKDQGERLGIIMGTLKEKVDGAGDAFQKTAAGGIAVTKQSMKDLHEEIGKQLLPAYTSILDWTNKVITGWKYLAQQASDTASDIKAFFTDGFAGAAANKAQRELEKIDRLNKNIVSDLIDELQGKSTAEIGEKIVEVQNRLVGLQEKLKRATANRSGIYDKKDIDDATNGIKLLRLELDALFKLQDGKDRNLGISQKDVEETDKNLKKILDDYKQLSEALAALKLARQSDFFSPLDKEVSEMDLKFAKLKELAHGNREKLKQIDAEYYEQLFSLQLKYSRLELQEYFRLKNEQEKRAQELADKLAAFGVQTSTNDQFKGVVDLVNMDTQAKHDLELEKATGQEKLDIQKEDLRKAEQQEIDSVQNLAAARGASEETVQNVIAKIKYDYREKERELEIQHYAAMANRIIGFVQQAFQLIQKVAELQTQKENAELANFAENVDKKKKKLDDNLKSNLITQLEHDRQVQSLEKQQEKREKELRKRQFYRNQGLSIIQTQINGAQAAINALTVQPYYVGIALAIAAGIETAAEVAFIRAQKPPDYGNGGLYGDGGKTTGRSHSTGGNPIIDGNTGKKIGEIEHDEGIINKRSMRDRNQYTVSGTVSQIGSLLNRLHGGVHWEPGARLVPVWRTLPPAQINIPNIQRYYGLGGTFTAGTSGQALSNSTQAAQAKQNEEVNSMLIGTLQEMRETMAGLQGSITDLQTNGVNAYTVLSQQEKQQARMDAIRSDATIKG